MDSKELKIGDVLFCDYIPDNVIVTGIRSDGKIETDKGVYDLESLDVIPLKEL
jgi:hypothetical protein